jgi:hypothetical protein
MFLWANAEDRTHARHEQARTNTHDGSAVLTGLVARYCRKEKMQQRPATGDAGICYTYTCVEPGAGRQLKTKMVEPKRGGQVRDFAVRRRLRDHISVKPFDASANGSCPPTLYTRTGTSAARRGVKLRARPRQKRNRARPWCARGRLCPTGCAAWLVVFRRRLLNKLSIVALWQRWHSYSARVRASTAVIVCAYGAVQSGVEDSQRREKV